MANPFLDFTGVLDGDHTDGTKPGNMSEKPVNTTTGLVWDWQNNYIESDHTHIPSLAAQPDSTLFLVGPARNNGKVGDNNPGNLKPVGYIQGIQAAQQRMVQRLYDFGSARSFFTVGKSSGSITISRLFFKGASLLASLYNYAITTGSGDGTRESNIAAQAVFNTKMYTGPAAGKLTDDLSTGGFFIDIGSELFLNPFGCALVYRSKSGHAIGGVYFELCMFETHTIQMDPNTPQMMENVNVQFDRATPFNVQSDHAGTKQPGSFS